MLGEPHEMNSEPVKHDHLVHDRGVQAWHVHAQFRCVAEIVDGADAKGWTHDACSPMVGDLSSIARPWPSPRYFRLARSHAEQIRTAVLPGAVAFADARRWADQRFQIDPLVGHGRDGFGLVSREVELLDPFGGVAEAAPDHDLVVKIFGAVAHAAHIERHLRLEARQGPFDVVVDLDMDRGLDSEILQALAVAGAAEAFLQPGTEYSMAPGTKPVGSQPSAISAVSLTFASAPVAS